VAQNQPESSGVIAGRNAVREALQRGDASIEKVLLAQTMRGRLADEIRGAAKEAGVPVQFVPQTKLDHLAGGANHQGVVAISSPVEYADLDEMMSRIAADPDEVRAKKPLVIALDEIEDPYNFGAILRSSVAAGAAGIVVPERKMAPVSAVTVKASAGAALRIPIARVTNLADSLVQLKERGYWVAGLEGEAEESVWTLDWDRPFVIVVGNEGRGLRPRVQQVCDHLVSIPIRGAIESLNASVAAGVAMFAAVRARTD
jgi:23S rRNA (guanosine2251-2'-O)-methyltransferase